MKIELSVETEKMSLFTPASPVVLISTISKDGIRNLAPIGYFAHASSKPPMITIGVGHKADTHKNILDTKEFVVGIPTPEISQQVFDAGISYAPEIDEFEKTGLTPTPSSKISAAKIKECKVNLECVLEWSKTAGNHTVFCGRIIAADIDEKLYNGDKVELRKSFSRLYHITGNAFLADGKIVFTEKQKQ
jgi:flavin reductase (DIM6/NTAB) family NADH-FMN oxidoreductase RutF